MSSQFSRQKTAPRAVDSLAAAEQVIVSIDNDDAFDRLARWLTIAELLPGCERFKVSHEGAIHDPACEGAALMASQAQAAHGHLAVVTSRIEGHLWSVALFSVGQGGTIKERTLTLAFRPVFERCSAIVAHVQGAVDLLQRQQLRTWLESLKARAEIDDEVILAKPSRPGLWRAEPRPARAFDGLAAASAA
jgi:hypothetical protein